MVLLINFDRILTKIMLKTLIKIVLRYRYRLKMRCVKSWSSLKGPSIN